VAKKHSLRERRCEERPTSCAKSGVLSEKGVAACPPPPIISGDETPPPNVVIGIDRDCTWPEWLLRRGTGGVVMV